MPQYCVAAALALCRVGRIGLLRKMALWRDFGHWDALQWCIVAAVIVALVVAICSVLKRS
jgi:hypothetical protein